MTLQIVHVQWIDSCALGEWTDVSELDHTFEMIDTVGLLIHADDTAYFVASTYDRERAAVNAAMWIPKACVRKLSPLGAIDI